MELDLQDYTLLQMLVSAEVTKLRRNGGDLSGATGARIKRLERVSDELDQSTGSLSWRYEGLYPSSEFKSVI